MPRDQVIKSYWNNISGVFPFKAFCDYLGFCAFVHVLLMLALLHCLLFYLEINSFQEALPVLRAAFPVKVNKSTTKT